MIDQDFPYMSRFFHVRDVKDAEQLNRICTLEYLFQRYNGEFPERRIKHASTGGLCFHRGRGLDKLPQFPESPDDVQAPMSAFWPIPSALPPRDDVVQKANLRRLVTRRGNL